MFVCFWSGSTADQVCHSSSVKRHLPPKYQLHRESRQAGDGKMVVKPSLQDKDTIFKLAANPKYFDEIQKKLQVRMCVCALRVHACLFVQGSELWLKNSAL